MHAGPNSANPTPFGIQVFFLVFLTASLGFLLLSGSFFQKANGNAALGLSLQKVSNTPNTKIVSLIFSQGCGGSWFVASLLGWCKCCSHAQPQLSKLITPADLIFVLMFDSVGFKIPLPVGDFTAFWTK